MKKIITLGVVAFLLVGCSTDKTLEKSEVDNSTNKTLEEIENTIASFEADIEEALLMTNAYQDAKYTSVHKKLEEFLSSVREEYDYNVSSAYEGLNLDEALEEYNKKNGTTLENITKNEMPGIQDTLNNIDETSKETSKKYVRRYEDELETGDDSHLFAYIESIVKSETEGISDYLTLEEARELLSSNSYSQWWNENRARIVNSKREEYSKLEQKKKTESSYASSYSNDSNSRNIIGTCKFDNPVDCAVAYIKDNYNIGFFTLSDNVDAYQNTKTQDYVIDVTIKGENVFGGDVWNTFRVTIGSDKKSIYSCVRK